MKTKLFLTIAFILAAAASAFAQGGKAEPNRISFAKGKTSATVTGTIKGDQQAEYIFGASEGQVVSIKITSTPKGKYANFNVVDPENYEQVDEESEMYTYTYTVQQTGDRVILVKFKPSGKVRSARYSLTLSIK